MRAQEVLDLSGESEQSLRDLLDTMTSELAANVSDMGTVVSRAHDIAIVATMIAAKDGLECEINDK